MVAQDDAAEHLPLGADDGPLSVGQEASPIIVVDDILARIAARYDVVDGAVEFDAESSGHADYKTAAGGSCQRKTTPNAD